MVLILTVVYMELRTIFIHMNIQKQKRSQKRELRLKIPRIRQNVKLGKKPNHDKYDVVFMDYIWFSSIIFN